METVEITLRVPRSYLDEAADFGMLDPDTLNQVLRDELDRRIIAFVNAEVKAYRAEQQTGTEAKEKHE